MTLGTRIKAWLKSMKKEKPAERVGDMEACLELSESPNLAISKRGMDLIKHFESLLEVKSDGLVHAYLDPVGIPTIGWGTIQYPNGKKVRMGDVIGRDEADRLLHWEVGEKAKAVASLVKVHLSSDEFSALVSFAYNVGTGALRGSTLLKKLNLKDYNGAADQLLRWNKAGGQALRGLTRRRESERKLFLGHQNYIVKP